MGTKSNIEKEDKIILAQGKDKIRQCLDRGYITWTGFLDSHQQSILRKNLGNKTLGCKVEFFGGYDGAERVIMICVPEYMSFEDEEVVTAIRCKKLGKSGKKLSHSDYLGSILSLGITRDLIGDIIVSDEWADIIVLKEISDFLLNNYSQAGRTTLSVENMSLDELMSGSDKKEVINTTIASLRLDNVVAKGFNISRTKSCESIRSGVVLVNHIEVNRPDFMISEGDLITFRKKGRLKLVEVGGYSKKNRTYITLEK